MNITMTKSKDIEQGDGALKEGTVTIVTDLETYEGKTLEEKLDTFVAAHPVVMINRSWCLFSVDAIAFLTKQLGVSIHSLEIDVHPQGKDIIKYLGNKLNHKT